MARAMLNGIGRTFFSEPRRGFSGKSGGPDKAIDIHQVLRALVSKNPAERANALNSVKHLPQVSESLFKESPYQDVWEGAMNALAKNYKVLEHLFVYSQVPLERRLAIMHLIHKEHGDKGLFNALKEFHSRNYRAIPVEPYLSAVSLVPLSELHHLGSFSSLCAESSGTIHHRFPEAGKSERDVTSLGRGERSSVSLMPAQVVSAVVDRLTPHINSLGEQSLCFLVWHSPDQSTRLAAFEKITNLQIKFDALLFSDHFDTLYPEAVTRFRSDDYQFLKLFDKCKDRSVARSSVNGDTDLLIYVAQRAHNTDDRLWAANQLNGNTVALGIIVASQYFNNPGVIEAKKLLDKPTIDPVSSALITATHPPTRARPAKLVGLKYDPEFDGPGAIW